ncbi:phage integrase SAM-like domain-containing protein [uncultured Chryseobacterium sp.]|uniref:phage integrase SAM-like domain-containing protein n=1 Tax=uncultured Chryseobacterium sp. TaxID=259322 RepID=UPI002600D82F|nr:phage integrase SAM-like domain-containing protein [uncultured Chryseobacterium sp.]
MATVKFRVLHQSDNAQIYVRFSINRDNVFQTGTGLFIKYTDWSKDKSAPKQTTAQNKQIAIQLKQLDSFIMESYNVDYSNGVVFSKTWLQGRIDAFFGRNQQEAFTEVKVDNTLITCINEYTIFKRGLSTTRPDLIRKLTNLRDRFAGFQIKKKKIYDLDQVSGKILTDFRDYLISDCAMMESTASRFVKNIKTVIFDAQSNGNTIHPSVKGSKTGSTNSEHIVYLSFEEIEKIKKKELSDKWLIQARDWLVIGCFLGQRASDLLRMDRKMIYTKTDSEGNSFRFLELTQQKTKQAVVIPLHDEVEAVLQKYDGNFPAPFADNQDSNTAIFNRYIKIVCEAAGIHDMVKGKVFNEDTMRNEITETEKCNLVSSHICRRSFASNFYGNKHFTTPQLMAITGHKSEAQFLNYIGRTSDDWAMQTARTFREIAKK